ncbi:phosphoribosylformylglycinamidine synthase [Glaesserella parasuis ZJ0906]|uniref:Phosphoribosylformylglycinamidine synthase n=1 Tax=Glaesserella parasuis ZJ0906 TaxID=1322346 RepID=A0A806JHX3_GLAPU|nr:phosphoribosylformylglycinamidine synthase [Glaesserella parasuis ZJ0906]
MTVQTFRGSPALSDFRLNQLQQKFEQHQLPVKSVYAEYLHFVELNRPLVADETKKSKSCCIMVQPLRNTSQPAFV